MTALQPGPPRNLSISCRGRQEIFLVFEAPWRALEPTILSPWNRGFLEKLTGTLLIQKFCAFYGTRMFITAFTRALHLSLSSARSTLSMKLTTHLHPGPTFLNEWSCTSASLVCLYVVHRRYFGHVHCPDAKAHCFGCLFCFVSYVSRTRLRPSTNYIKVPRHLGFMSGHA